MKAVLFHNHGGPEVLEYTDFPAPEPGPGQVLVRLKAAALNRLDLWVRAGWPGINLAYPHIPGADGAGEVAAVGAGVNNWAPGDRVVINSNLSCGVCDFCLAGMDNRCRTWQLLGETVRGTYARISGDLSRKPVPDAGWFRIQSRCSSRAGIPHRLAFVDAARTTAGWGDGPGGRRFGRRKQRQHSNR